MELTCENSWQSARVRETPHAGVSHQGAGPSASGAASCVLGGYVHCGVPHGTQNGGPDSTGGAGREEGREMKEIREEDGKGREAGRMEGRRREEGIR